MKWKQIVHHLQSHSTNIATAVTDLQSQMRLQHLLTTIMHAPYVNSLSHHTIHKLGKAFITLQCLNYRNSRVLP